MEGARRIQDRVVRSASGRVGEWGGHVLVDCDDPLAVHKFCYV